MMAGIEDSRGRLVRDLMTSSSIDFRVIRQYDDYICHDEMSFRVPIEARNLSRFSPMADHDLFLLRESMVLWLARRHHGLPTASEAGFKAALDESGVTHLRRTYHPAMQSLFPIDIAAPPRNALPN